MTIEYADGSRASHPIARGNDGRAKLCDGCKQRMAA